MISLIELPGVRGVEDVLVINRGARVSTDWDLAARIDKVSVDVFGISRSDTEFVWPRWVFDISYDDLPDEKKGELEDLYNEWLEAYDIDENGEDKIAQFRQMGWSVTDGSDSLLLCLPHYERQIIAVTKGLMGKNIVDIRASMWEARLRNGRPSRSDPQRARLNKQFLELGLRPKR